MAKRPQKICFISSAGGHFEQIKQLKDVIKTYDCFYMVTRTKATEKMTENRYIIIEMLRTNKIMMIVSLVFMTIQQLTIFIKEQPQTIITTGAGVAIPMCLIGKIFGRKVIYIESFARINTPNKTGLFLYKYADAFIIQWEELRKYYPGAEYGGGIY
ncbi:MAG TPA: polysaccharide biosynthesis protein [Candidatus Jeotgalibaca pullicola]|nr:polysaccharide biosynthesis protein [Candidatus Jeotgalibaca pullicola]